MKRIITLFLCFSSIVFCFLNFQLKAQQTIIENVAGKLAEKASGKDLAQLKITGQLNAEDFKFLREQSVKELDLLEVDIVPGGEYIVNGETCTTTENSIPAYFLFYSPLSKTLTSLTLPATLEVLEKRSLQGASLLTTCEFPAGLKKIGELGLCDVKSLRIDHLPESLEEIGPFAFWGCDAIESLEVPESVKKIGDGAFSECKGLTDFDFPKTFLDIPNDVLKNCENITRVGFSPFLRSIGNRAFSGCKQLSSLSDFYMIEKIGKEAFKECSSISELNLASCPLKKIEMNTFEKCTSLTDVILPSNIKSIASYAFFECNQLQNIVLPAHLTTIMGGAFAGTAIEEVHMPKSCTQLGYAAFARSAIKTVILSENINTVSEAVFGGNSNLKRIYIHAKEPPVSEKLNFSGMDTIQGLTLYVPKGSKEKYAQAEGWKIFKNIQETGETTLELTGNKNLETQLVELEKGGSLKRENIVHLILKGTLEEEDLETISKLPLLQTLDMSQLTPLTSSSPLLEVEYGSYLSNVKIIKMPKGYTTVSAKAFYNAYHLEEVIFAENISIIGDEAFHNCTWLNSIPFISTSEDIGTWAFTACGALTEINLYPSIGEIKDYAFFGCSGIKEVVVPDECVYIGEGAFSTCSNIEKVKLGKKVEEIADFAFSGDRKIKGIYIKAEDPPSVSEQSFSPELYNTSTLYVPQSVDQVILKTYKETPVWQNFLNISEYDYLSNKRILSSKDLTVYGRKDAILFINKIDSPLFICIYDTKGKITNQVTIPLGETLIPCEKGFHIVKTPTSAIKVMVL